MWWPRAPRNRERINKGSYDLALEVLGCYFLHILSADESLRPFQTEVRRGTDPTSEGCI